MTSNLRAANESWESLMTAYARLMRHFADTTVWREHQLNMREYDVLYTLSKHRNPLRISELRDGVLLSQPALSRMVDRLARRGLVARTHDQHDGRAVRISLTQLGAELQRTVGRSHARSVYHAMRSLSPSEQQQLTALTKKLQK